jgi:hypothetical protein
MGWSDPSVRRTGIRRPADPRGDGTAVQAAQLLDDKALDDAVDAHGIVRSAVTERSG